MALFLVTASQGCSKSEPPAPAASPRPAATPTAVLASAAPAGASPAPATSPNPGAEADLNDFSDTADWEWNLADEADTDEFEIDADATSYYMPRGNMVTFKAKALNGTPPFTYTWDFGDGTPPVPGEMVKHKFDRVGQFEVMVWGKDASGATSHVNLGLMAAHPVEFGIRMQYDDDVIEKLKAQYPDYVAPSTVPIPAVTP